MARWDRLYGIFSVLRNSPKRYFNWEAVRYFAFTPLCFKLDLTNHRSPTWLIHSSTVDPFDIYNKLEVAIFSVSTLRLFAITGLVEVLAGLDRLQISLIRDPSFRHMFSPPRRQDLYQKRRRIIGSLQRSADIHD